jgi:hypothetical protein
MKQFAPSTTSKWIADQLYLDSDDALIGEFVRMYAKREQAEGGVEEVRPRLDNVNEFEYTVDIYMNNWVEEKIKALEKILEEYR